MHFDGESLVIDIEERGFPIIAPVRGQVRITPLSMPGRIYELDSLGRHFWRPIAPVARIDVNMRQPNLRWSGSAYLDHNYGLEPIEDGFKEWDWSRSDAGRSAYVLYDMKPRLGPKQSLALQFKPNGDIEPLELPPRQRMENALWGMARRTRSDGGASASIIRTMVDAPFYARSLMQSRIAGQNMMGMHESLSLDKLTMPVVQAMLPFKMPRVGDRRGFFY